MARELKNINLVSVSYRVELSATDNSIGNASLEMMSSLVPRGRERERERGEPATTGRDGFSIRCEFLISTGKAANDAGMRPGKSN